MRLALLRFVPLLLLPLACGNSGGQSGTDALDVNAGDPVDDTDDDDSTGSADDDSGDDDVGDDDDVGNGGTTNGSTGDGDDTPSGEGGAPAAGGTSSGGATSSGGQASGGNPSVVGSAGGMASSEVGSGGEGNAQGGGGNAAGQGGSSEGGEPAIGGGGTTGVGGSPSGGDYVVCPDAPPAAASSCDVEGLQCSWGSDPRFYQCRTFATCEGSSWTLQVPEPSCSEDALPEGCPEAPPEARSACDADGPAECAYLAGELCRCSNCHMSDPVCGAPGSGDPTWECIGGIDQAGCPPTYPNLGTQCTDDGTRCSYTCNEDFICNENGWQRTNSLGGCPKCAAPTTPIATPSGDRPIAALRPGDLVYSVHDDAIVVVPIVRINSTPVVNHRVMRVTLEDGVVLEISPGHPTAGGIAFSELRRDSFLDEQHRVVDARLVPYEYERTHDILPASDTGTYFAAGALIGSTLWSRAEADGAEELSIEPR